MSTSAQADLNRSRPFRRSTAAIAAAPVDGSEAADGTPPDIVMSAQTPTGLKTTGFFVGLKAPGAGAAVANAPGFSLVVWIRSPTTRSWFSCATVTINYNEADVTFDFNASELYFQILAASVNTNGNVYFHVWEQ